MLEFLFMFVLPITPADSTKWLPISPPQTVVLNQLQWITLYKRVVPSWPMFGVGSLRDKFVKTTDACLGFLGGFLAVARPCIVIYNSPFDAKLSWQLAESR
jgi:hypothetical protein